MAHAQTAPTRKAPFFGLFSNYADAKVEQFRRRIYSKTVRDLEALGDDQLLDIGIPRDEIKQRAYQSVYHNAPYPSQV